MLTIRNTNVEAINRDIVNVGGHEIRCTWNADGCTADRDQLRAIRDAGDANWSDEEIGAIAYHAETMMQEAFEVTAKHEVRVPEGTGWYVYRNMECQGGPWQTEQDAIDAETRLHEATDEQLSRFDAAARSAGHPSGKAVANECNLWGMTVADAIAAAGNQEECE